jgi:hypothetical protein
LPHTWQISLHLSYCRLPHQAMQTRQSSMCQCSRLPPTKCSALKSITHGPTICNDVDCPSHRPAVCGPAGWMAPGCNTAPFHPSSHPQNSAYSAVGSTYQQRSWWQSLPQRMLLMQPTRSSPAWCPTTVCWRDPQCFGEVVPTLLRPILSQDYFGTISGTISSTTNSTLNSTLNLLQNCNCFEKFKVLFLVLFVVLFLPTVTAVT